MPKVLDGVLVDCLTRNGRRFQFTPVFTEDDLRSPHRSRGLRRNDFHTVTAGDAASGCLAVWDQRAFKQVVVRGYSPLLSRARLLFNAFGRLLGVPPLLGFWGKLYLFIAGIEANQIPLVVIAGINSAISAWYYLRLIALPIMSEPNAQSETIERSPFSWPRIAGIVTAIAVVVLPVFAQPLFTASEKAAGTGAAAAKAGVDRSVSRSVSR